MVMSIQTNVNSLAAQRGLRAAQDRVNGAMQKLSTGFRINKAGDDAAGLAISEKLKSQINGLNQAMRNAMDGISMVQTAEGALGETADMLQRMRVLAVQSANDVNTAGERTAIQKEVSQLKAEITRLADSSTFNGANLLDGSFTSKQIQVGANQNQTISVSISSARAADIGNNTFSASGDMNEATAAAATAAAVNNVDAQDLTVTGELGSGTVTLAAGATAKDIAEAVNNLEGSTGVTATATTGLKHQRPVNDAPAACRSPSRAPTAATINANIADPSDLRDLVDAVNERTATTGVTAEIGANNGEVVLRQADGEDVVIEGFTSSGTGAQTVSVQGLDAAGATAGAAVTLTEGAADSTRVGGDLTFNSTGSFQVSSDTGAAGVVTAAATANASSLTSVASVDVSTRQGSQDAIQTIDSALGKLNNLRSTLGAIQNRFESTVSALESTAENLSASNSRIRDVDVASESAELARAQVLSQAGVSVLAQANQQPQLALKLLG
jgi:flagellin